MCTRGCGSGEMETWRRSDSCPRRTARQRRGRKTGNVVRGVVKAKIKARKRRSQGRRPLFANPSTVRQYTTGGIRGNPPVSLPGRRRRYKVRRGVTDPIMILKTKRRQAWGRAHRTLVGDRHTAPPLPLLLSAVTLAPNPVFVCVGNPYTFGSERSPPRTADSHTSRKD